MTPNGREQSSGGDGLLVGVVRNSIARSDQVWQIASRRPWCYVSSEESRRRQPLQGWKLHISATPLSAALVLHRAAAILLRRKCSFKFSETLADVVASLGRNANRASAGKFLTAYPDQDTEELRSLAAELHEATVGLPGPVILSDRPFETKSLVHYRFGAFSGAMVLANEGSYEALLVAPDGSLQIDQRKAWFVTPSWAPSDPFAVENLPEDGEKPTTRPVLLAERYLVKKVIRHLATGGVYRASDTRAGKSVIIKQARRNTGATYLGLDATDLRRHEERVLRELEHLGWLPRALDFFEQQEDTFLVEEEIEGDCLRGWAALRAFPREGEGGCWGVPRDDAVAVAIQLVECLKSIHASGFVVRDLSPGNVMVNRDGRVRLIDVELFARPGERTIQAYTLGYGSPEQVSSDPIGPALPYTSDLYGLGALLFFIATCIDPLLPVDVPGVRVFENRLSAWLTAMSTNNPAAQRFHTAITSLMRRNPRERSELADVLPALGNERSSISTWSGSTSGEAHEKDPIEALIQDAQAYLLATRDVRESGRLWPVNAMYANTDVANIHHGAAGPLGVLARALVHRPSDDLKTAVLEIAQWTIAAVRREPRSLPGLHFGRSGTAWALLEAGIALESSQIIHEAKQIALRIPLDWPNPDICHGLAGAGLTQIRFWEVTGEASFLERTEQIARVLETRAERDGPGLRWPIPKGLASELAGLTHYGFAHGVAGVGAFLLAAGRATGSQSFIELALRGAEALTARIKETEAGVLWPIDADRSGWNKNWCSGGSGIGTFLLRVWGETGDAKTLNWAKVAADEIYTSRWFGGSCQCHGLSGDAELLLDLETSGAADGYRAKALDVIRTLYLRDVRIGEWRLVPDELGQAVTSSYGTGLAGVLALLLRFQWGGERMWMPEVLRPAHAHLKKSKARSAVALTREPSVSVGGR